MVCGWKPTGWGVGAGSSDRGILPPGQLLMRHSFVSDLVQEAFTSQIGPFVGRGGYYYTRDRERTG